MFELFAYKNRSEGSLFFLLFESVSLRELWLDLKAAGAPLLLKTFTFEDEDDNEYEIWPKVFLRILKISTSRKASFYRISLEKLALLSLVKEVKCFPDCKMIKLLTFDILFFPAQHSR